jgi:uncharacterized protein YbjT (DUF2867 family)
MPPALPSLILVTGGTGNLGHYVVRGLEARGCRLRVMSRKQRGSSSRTEYVVGDLARAIGIGDAVAGASVIVHCASARRGDDVVTRNLINAARASAIKPHLVFVSIVGVSDIRFSYFQTKLACEKIVMESGLPWTLQRATQFYDYLYNGTKQTSWMPIIPVPKDFKVQPIDPTEVALKLVELALGPPQGRVPDIGGPEVSTWAEMTRQYLRLTGRRRPILQFSMPGTRSIRNGALLVAGGDTRITYGKTTWEQFLRRRLAAGGATAAI